MMYNLDRRLLETLPWRFFNIKNELMTMFAKYYDNIGYRISTNGRIPLNKETQNISDIIDDLGILHYGMYYQDRNNRSLTSDTNSVSEIFLLLIMLNGRGLKTWEDAFFMNHKIFELYSSIGKYFFRKNDLLNYKYVVINDTDHNTLFKTGKFWFNKIWVIAKKSKLHCHYSDTIPEKMTHPFRIIESSEKIVFEFEFKELVSTFVEPANLIDSIIFCASPYYKSMKEKARGISCANWSGISPLNLPGLDHWENLGYRILNDLDHLNLNREPREVINSFKDPILRKGHIT